MWSSSGADGATKTGRRPLLGPPARLGRVSSQRSLALSMHTLGHSRSVGPGTRKARRPRRGIIRDAGPGRYSTTQTGKTAHDRRRGGRAPRGIHWFLMYQTGLASTGFVHKKRIDVRQGRGGPCSAGVRYVCDPKARTRETTSRRHRTSSERLSGNSAMNDWREEGRVPMRWEDRRSQRKDAGKCRRGKVTLARLWRQCTVHARIGAPAEWHIFDNTYEKAGTPEGYPGPASLRLAILIRSIFHPSRQLRRGGALA